eukprot:GHVP01051447.1.p1 GENE.GHVP01051447.1~~GHVP01051447.1.p1  ORF type:complete len:159 (+),score=15.24 GHVP01051447.1:301-777(+)
MAGQKSASTVYKLVPHTEPTGLCQTTSYQRAGDPILSELDELCRRHLNRGKNVLVYPEEFVPEKMRIANELAKIDEKRFRRLSHDKTNPYPDKFTSQIRYRYDTGEGECEILVFKSKGKGTRFVYQRNLQNPQLFYKIRTRVNELNKLEQIFGNWQQL